MEVQKSIILSGTPASGKSKLIQKLVEAYGFQVIHFGGILREMHASQYPNNEVTFEKWYDGKKGKELEPLNQEVKRRFESGNIIGDSRFVASLDPEKCIFVFLDADVKIKAERVITDPKRPEYFGKPLEEVIGILTMREGSELRIGKELYGLDYDYRDPSHYHLVLNSGRLTIQQEFEAIDKLAKESNSPKKKITH